MPAKNPTSAKRTSKSAKDAPLVAHPVPKHPVNKSLVLEMIIAKLEDSKTCDWHALSQRLAGKGIGHGGKVGLEGKGKGKGKAKGKATELSGADLHDLYHNFILPGLKCGRALWRDNDVDSAEEGDEDTGNSSKKRGRAAADEGGTASQLPGSKVDPMVDDSEDENDSDSEEEDDVNLKEEPPVKRRCTTKSKAAGMTSVDAGAATKPVQPATSPLSTPKSEAMSDEWNVLCSPTPIGNTKVSRPAHQMGSANGVA